MPQQINSTNWLSKKSTTAHLVIKKQRLLPNVALNNFNDIAFQNCMIRLRRDPYDSYGMTQKRPSSRFPYDTKRSAFCIASRNSCYCQLLGWSIRKTIVVGTRSSSCLLNFLTSTLLFDFNLRKAASQEEIHQADLVFDFQVVFDLVVYADSDFRFGDAGVGDFYWCKLHQPCNDPFSFLKVTVTHFQYELDISFPWSSHFKFKEKHNVYNPD